MRNLARLQKLVRTFPEVTQEPHFEKISFRVKKKIFATCDASGEFLTVKLSEIDQNVFSSISKDIYPLPNKWGKQGWTRADVAKIKVDILNDLLTTAYCQVAPKKLAALVEQNIKLE